MVEADRDLAAAVVVEAACPDSQCTAVVEEPDQSQWAEEQRGSAAAVVPAAVPSADLARKSCHIVGDLVAGCCLRRGTSLSSNTWSTDGLEGVLDDGAGKGGTRGRKL